MLAMGLFADGSFGNGYNGVPGTVHGLLYGGGSSQVLCQLIAVVACIAWASIISLLTLAVTERLLGPNRVSHDVEGFGLDIPEMGASGYPEFISNTGLDNGLERSGG
jgi:Amt family ammonium transporter